MESNERDIVTRVWTYLSYPLQEPFYFIPVFADQIRDYSSTEMVHFFKEIGISCIAEGSQCICYLSRSNDSISRRWRDQICTELVKDPTFAWHVAAIAWLFIAMSKEAFFAAVPFEWLEGRIAQISVSKEYYLHYLHLKETQAQTLAKQLEKEKEKEKKKKKQEEKERKSPKGKVEGERVGKKKKNRSGLKAR